MVGAGTLAAACLWDSDTLAMEAKGLPDVVDAIGGRFDRNPDLYYVMRLARVMKVIDADPHVHAEYGDAAVALDKLGRGGEAIELLEGRILHDDDG